MNDYIYTSDNIKQQWKMAQNKDFHRLFKKCFSTEIRLLREV